MSIFNPARLPPASTGFSPLTRHQCRIKCRSQMNLAPVMAWCPALMPLTTPHQRVTHSSPVYLDKSLKMVSLRRLQEFCAKTCSSLVLQATL
ncbi:hypothetical protein P692DRAFT_20680805, partial [Suillus brevipes Sb2]